MNTCQQLGQAKLPPSIAKAMGLGRMVALQKPPGGVRGLVVGDILRRVVARTMAPWCGGPCSHNSHSRQSHQQNLIHRWYRGIRQNLQTQHATRTTPNRRGETPAFLLSCYGMPSDLVCVARFPRPSAHGHTSRRRRTGCDLQGVPLLPPKPGAQCHEDDPGRNWCVRRSHER